MSIGNLVFCEGDSLTSGTGASSDANRYPDQMLALSPQVYTLVNGGSASATITNINTNAAASIDSVKSGTGYPNYICIIWAGTNDLVLGEDGNDVAAEIETFVLARQAQGWLVIVCTVIDRQNVGLPGGFQTERAACNTDITSSSSADAIVDLADDARLADATDTTYFNSDRIHLNDAGYGVVADLIDAAVQGLLVDDPPDTDIAASAVQMIPELNSRYLQQDDASVVISGALAAVAGIMEAPHTGNITEIRFRVRAFTSGSTLEGRIESVNASGDPSTTLLDTGAEGTVAVAGTGQFTITLGTPLAVTKGDLMAVLIRQPSASPGNPDEIGNKFQLSYGVQVTGVAMRGNSHASAGYVFTLYDSLDNVIATKTTIAGLNLSGNNLAEFYFFDDVYTVAKNEIVRLTVQSTDGTNTIQIFFTQFADTTDRDANGWGAGIIRTHRTNGGAWTDTATERCSIALLVAGVDIGADFPNETDVRLGVAYDNGDRTGLLTVPGVDDVRLGVAFDIASEGTLELPDEEDVRDGTFYGADGTEFEGEMTGGTGGKIIGSGV